MRCRVIHTSFAPSVAARDAAHAASLLLHPGEWRAGPGPEAFAHALAGRLGLQSVQHPMLTKKHRMLDTGIQLVDSGRNALRLALTALGVRSSDEVLLQAFTCVSVPGPVLWLGAQPVYVDIDPATYNMDPDDLRRKISANAKVVILQHTFGLPADFDELLAIARERNLAVIEDCAHALGSTYHGRPVGMFGDAAIFSFGRDKVISSVFGGALVINRADLVPPLQAPSSKLQAPPTWWVARQLLHTALAPTLRATYYCGGRFALRAALKLNVLSKALTNQEKWGGQPPLQPSELANALALRALDQFARLDVFIEHRQAIATHYTESLQDLRGVTLPIVPGNRSHGFLRYAVRVPNREALHAAAQQAGIVLRDAWYDMVVAPRETNLRAVQYISGSCPRAEEAAAHVVNLPTSPTLRIADVNRVLRVVRTVLRTPHSTLR